MIFSPYFSVGKMSLNHYLNSKNIDIIDTTVNIIKKYPTVSYFFPPCPKANIAKKINIKVSAD